MYRQVSAAELEEQYNKDYAIILPLSHTSSTPAPAASVSLIVIWTIQYADTANTDSTARANAAPAYCPMAARTPLDWVKKLEVYSKYIIIAMNVCACKPRLYRKHWKA